MAAHLEPEILIVDEVLAVGDAAFQKKCLGKMGDVADEGRTVLFVSHNMAAVESLCRGAILLDDGQVIASGSAHEIVTTYAEHATLLGSSDIEARTDRRGNGRVRITGIAPAVRTGSDSSIRIRYRGEDPVRNVDFALALFTTRGEGVAHLSTSATGGPFKHLPKRGEVTCRLPRASVAPGLYRVNAFCTIGGQVADWVTDAAVIEVAEGDFYGSGRLPPSGYGSVLVEHSWVSASAPERVESETC